MANVVIIASFAESLVNFRGELLRALVGRGHDVVAAAPELTDAIKLQLDDIGASYHEITLSRRGINPFRDTRSIFELTRLLLDFKPDYVFLYTVKPVVYGGLASRLAGVPNRCFLITGLGYAFSLTSWKTRLLNQVVARLYRWALVNAKVVFFQNRDDLAEFEQRRLLDRVRQSIVVNGSGVDTRAFQPAPLPNRPVFLLIGRLLRAKGIYDYAAAAATVKRAHPQARFHLVGWLESGADSIDESDLERWQHDGLIEYPGSTQDVRPFIEAARVYVLPSYREGTPRTVLEAMAMGRPIITTDTPGCRETVVDGVNGYLVPVRDSEALSKAMLKLINNPELAAEMGRQSRDIACTRYDVGEVNANILEHTGL